jgi:HlyD family secretion protein
MRPAFHTTRRRIFRTAALDRLSSPEQLDSLVTLTDPQGWIALLTLIGVFAAIVMWSLLGSLPTNIRAEGILIPQGGRLVDAMTPALGQLGDLRVAVDDWVEKGEAVAVVRQTEIEQQLKHARELASEQRKALVQLRSSFEREIKLKRSNFAARKVAIDQVIAAAKSRAKYLQRSLTLQEKQAEQGYVAQQKIEEQRMELNRVRQEIADARNEILKLEADELDLVTRIEQELTHAEQRFNETKRRVGELKVKLASDSSVRAPASGRVTEIKLTEGAVVHAGQAVLSIELAGETLQAILYIPTEHGKKVRPEMTVRIEPATVKKEESGTLIGKVRDVSDFPATPEGMATVLQNKSLIAQFSRTGPPYAARVDLVPAATPSGYRWSSGQGPNLSISSGTTLRAEITVHEQRPIDLAIPLLKKYTGVYQ